MESENVAKVEEKKSEKSVSCCANNHGMKSIMIVIAILVVLGGIACVAKLMFVRHGINQVSVKKNSSFGQSGFEGGYGGRMMGGRGTRGQTGAGLIGKITKINGDNLTIHKDSNNKDYTVVIADTTQIQKDGDVAAKSELVIGQAITIRGGANSSGQIAANIIIIN